MALKVDGGVSVANTHREVTEVKKPEVKPSFIKTDNPQTNAAVYTNQSIKDNQANALRAKLNARFVAQTTPSAPTLTPQEAQAKADEIIKKNGGKDNLDTEGVGRDLAEIAKTNPSDAWAITQAMLGDTIDQGGKGKVKENDKDEIAQSFAQHLSDAELKTIGENADGKAMLEKFKAHLLSGSVHDDERADALRLETAAKGYPPPNLTGNPEKDIQNIANDLKNIPPDKRDDYLMEVLQSPYGKDVLQRAGLLNNDDRDVLASAINEAYKQNPSAVASQLNAVTDMEKQFPFDQWTGLADVIRRTGNDDLITGYAKHAMELANSGDPKKENLAVDALTALGGISPQGLNNFINQDKTNFNKMLTTAAGFLGGPANNVGFANPWAFNPAMADFLDAASRMTDANGNLNSNALDIFKTVAPLTGDNFFTKEALGKMFIEHAQQITDTFALKRNADGTTNRNFDPNVLKDFFINVVYSPISDLLKYNGKSMVETIMGDGKGNSGLIGQLAQNIMDKAAKPGADVTYLGQEIGYLFGSVSGGFLDSVQAYKDKFNDDKEFREFLYGAVNKGLGALAKKVGLPLDKVGEFAEKLIEASKANDKKEQLKKFQEAFLDLKNQMSQTLLDFQRTHPNAEGLETNFTIAWNDFITSYLATDWIAR